MKKFILVSLLAALLTGCGAAVEAGAPSDPVRVIKEPVAELYIRETIEPEEVGPVGEEDKGNVEDESTMDAASDPEAEVSGEDPEAGDGLAGDPAADADLVGEEPEGPLLEDETLEEADAGQAVNASDDDDSAGVDAGGEDGSGEDGSGSGTAYLYGTCTISAYCPCSRCCGEWAGGPTASGVMPRAGRTAAADLPFGTRLLIDGHEYVVEDRGVSGMWIDIYVDSHEEALQLGLREAEVYIIG